MRPEGAAIGGHYATPLELVPSIAGLLALDYPLIWLEQSRSFAKSPSRRLCIVDPCCGTAEAVKLFADTLVPSNELVSTPPVEFALCEAEQTRCNAAKGHVRKGHSISSPPHRVEHGDAFRLRWATGSDRIGASVLYLNCPYDYDREHKRTEARWLYRFADVLCMGGVLVFIVPHYVLGVCAPFLATHFTGIHTYRFPGDAFDVFKQVVLVANRQPATLAPDPAVVATLTAIADDATLAPELPEHSRPVLTVRTVASEADEEIGFSEWKIEPIDFVALSRAFVPWSKTTRAGKLEPIHGILPDTGVAGLTEQTFHVAMPLHAGHVAPALACGVFNGVRLLPNASASHLPPILLRAVFRRNWQTTDLVENKDGETVAERQVQVPELVMTALDLTRGKFVRAESSAARTSARSLETMTIADVLACYSDELLATLWSRCPPAYDPTAPHPPVEGLSRALYPAQEHVVGAVVEQLRTTGSAIVMGETGTGKTTVASAVTHAIDARRVLVLCPPHLLTTWQAEVAATLPEARTQILQDVADADAFLADSDPKPLFALVAETSGKLTHGWVGIGGATDGDNLADPSDAEEVTAHRATFLDKRKRTGQGRAPKCPRCGASASDTADGLAKRRQRCGARSIVQTREAAIAIDLAMLLARVDATNPHAASICQAAGRSQWLARTLASQILLQEDDGTDPGIDAKASSEARAARWQALRPLLRPLVRRLLRTGKDVLSLARLLVAIGDHAFTRDTALLLHGYAERADKRPDGHPEPIRRAAMGLLLLIPPNAPEQIEGMVRMEARTPPPKHEYTRDTWKDWRSHRDAPQPYGTWGDYLAVSAGSYFYAGHAHGDMAAAFVALSILTHHVKVGPTCGEALYQAVPRPRRIALSHYLARKQRRSRGRQRVVDLVIADEAHEMANQDSAIGASLEQWRGTPIVALTGSLSNGYVASLFHLLYVTSASFRQEFGRDDLADMVRRYGFMRRVVEERDPKTKKPVVFGSMSDRVERSERTTGYAPGMLPSFLLRHVLSRACVLHLEDLAINLPPMTERVEMLDAGDELGSRVRAMRTDLLSQIARDRFTQRAGKLFGAMSEEWSSADRASLGVGNDMEGRYRVRYPESVGGDVVTELEPMPADLLLPKEQRLVEIVRGEIAEGRNVLVCAWHAHCGLYERLAGLLGRELGVDVPILDSNRVTARKRDEWLRTKVVAKGKRVMIVNPAAVETGLNSLVHFSTLIGFQPPGCDPRAQRQVMGRIRRPGQAREQRVIWLVYERTSQELLRTLLLHKVAESMSVDGLDATATMKAAGIGQAQGISGYDIGRQLYLMAAREMGMDVHG